MKEQVGVEHTNCSCHNCVPDKPLTVSGYDLAGEGGDHVASILCMPKSEYDRLSRLDENIKKKVEEFKNKKSKSILEQPRGVSDHIAHLEWLIELLENLDR